jgi:hypothetical protein
VRAVERHRSSLDIELAARVLIRCVQSGAPKQVLEIADIAALAEA